MKARLEFWKAAAALAAFAVMSTGHAQQGWGRNPERFTMDRTENGQGSVRVGGRDYSFSSMRVIIQRGGRVTLRAIKRGVDVQLTGRWSANAARGNTMAFTIDRVSYRENDTDRTQARGMVQLRGNDRFSRVEVNGNNLRLTFRTRGTAWDRDDDGRDNDWDRDWDDNVRDLAGRYTDYESWSRGGQEFQIRYTLDLMQGRRARLVAASTWDRNMPNTSTDRERHGDILVYLHTGQDVTQTGTWRRDGNRVIIDLDRIEYGRTSRSKSERLVGEIRGSAIYIETWDREFYGRDARMTFERS